MDQSASMPFCFLAAESLWRLEFYGFLTWKSEVLAMGKGIFGATTIIPDSIGWANCKAANLVTKTLKAIKHSQMRNVFSEWEDTHTHTQHPTTDVNIFIYFASPHFVPALEVPPEAFGWWGFGLLSKRGVSVGRFFRLKTPKSWYFESFWWMKQIILPWKLQFFPPKWGENLGIQFNFERFSWSLWMDNHYW